MNEIENNIVPINEDLNIAEYEIENIICLLYKVYVLIRGENIDRTGK